MPSIFNGETTVKHLQEWIKKNKGTVFDRKGISGSNAITDVNRNSLMTHPINTGLAY